MNDTQIKILEAAEAEFAEFGFVGASIRNITQRAGVNLASVNYHFGTKEQLIKHLLLFRITPLNQLRLNNLHKEQERHQGEAVPIPILVNLLVRPALEKMLTVEGGQFVRAMARCMSEPLGFIESLDRDVFHEIFTAYYLAFQKALPGLDEQAVAIQMNFVVCTMVGMMMHFPRMDNLRGKNLSKEKFDQILDQFIDFISSGVEGSSQCLIHS
ncbi:MAG: TetR/AcrR family transcriptional regulator [Verrucomicrobia bacterium]|nr:TetR/AcrR family transcriptional regulator [Verrucomicrobiota bacterium]